MGPVKYENVGKAQSVLVMINSIISTRTRNPAGAVELVRKTWLAQVLQHPAGQGYQPHLPAVRPARGCAGSPEGARAHQLPPLNGQLPPLNGHTRTRPTDKHARPTRLSACGMQRGYHAATTFIDAQIGKLLTALDTLSLRQSTIVAVIGDRAPVTLCLPPC
eukprot:COSAG01_NODE_3080_length_6628_cov_1.802420_3_plen_162_part_00